MSPHPLTLALSAPNRLRIEWSDGLRREYGCRELRDACPCATCREQRKAAPAELLHELGQEVTP
ncbi:MAG: DUF971 domain-containing protein [Planctomycetia bacterium]|nr:DUF971 domain-containing protein [Planctomycetia bacterium]